MHFFTVFTVFAAVSLATFIVPRTTQPSDWPDFLEPWKTYHARYISFGCEENRQSDFFANCCHPLTNKQTAAVLPPQCRPGNNAVDDGDVEGDNGDVDDGDDGDGDDCDETTTVTSQTSTTFHAPTAAVATHTTAPSTQSTGEPITGGFITYFFQNGNAGACGKVHLDTDLVCALDSARYNNGEFCGREITIEANHNTVNVIVADECPTCVNGNSIDLSVAAFEALAPTAVGMLPATWTMLP